MINRIKEPATGLEIKPDQNKMTISPEQVALSQSSYKDTIRELHEKEALLRSLADNLPPLLIRFNRELKIVYMSKKSEEFTGIPAHEFTGKTCKDAGLSVAVCRQWQRAVKKVIRTGKIKYIEYSLVSARKSRDFNLALAPEFDQNGQVAYVLGVSIDITYRKKMEKKIRKLLQEREG